MKINNMPKIDIQTQTRLTDTKPKKIEVLVGALTENDVKDHGTTTGVVKTVNKERNKIKPHLTGKLAKETDQLKDAATARKVMGVIKNMIIHNPAEAIVAQANQTPKGALQLLK